jgi:hypothetical protein
MSCFKTANENVSVKRCLRLIARWSTIIADCPRVMLQSQDTIPGSRFFPGRGRASWCWRRAAFFFSVKPIRVHPSMCSSHRQFRPSIGLENLPFPTAPSRGSPSRSQTARSTSVPKQEFSYLARIDPRRNSSMSQTRVSAAARRSMYRKLPACATFASWQLAIQI